MNKIIEKFKILLRNIHNTVFIALFYIFRIFKVQSNKIVFANFGGKGYGDNPKYIADEIIRQRLNYEMVWLIKDNKTKGFPKEIRTVKIGTIKACFELATAKMWIDNVRKSASVRKRKQQYYIQTWHGGNPIKKVEKDAESLLSADYVLAAKNDSKMANLFISNSIFTTERYRSSFWYNGKILECGSPRNDILMNSYNSHIKKRIKEELGIAFGTKILLYTPTFRADGNVEVYLQEYDNVLNALENKFGGKWISLVRLHPNISSKSRFSRLSQKTIDLSRYDDIQELMVVSDIMITDFSSTMFDFALTFKPVFQYVRDIAEYKRERDFVIDIFSLPFPIAQSDEELICNIEDFKEDQYVSSLSNWFASVGNCEYGTASYQVVERIKNTMRVRGEV